MAVELGRLREEVTIIMLSYTDIYSHFEQITCTQLASLCENVSSLACGSGSGSGGGDRQSPTCSPTTTVSAVSKLIQEHSEISGKLTTVKQQLKKVELQAKSLNVKFMHGILLI